MTPRHADPYGKDREMNRLSTSRRRFLRLWLAGAGVAIGGRAGAQTQLEPTPSCGSGPTPRQTEGPYYRAGTPLKADFRADAGGEPILLVGRVVDTGCAPVRQAMVDLWHADAQGAYDNRGLRLRGHQLTDEEGRFAFQSIRPGRYPGRTPHYHVMIFAQNRRLLTTQLYFPGEAGNARDGLFDPRLLVRTRRTSDQTIAHFDFVVRL